MKKFEIKLTDAGHIKTLTIGNETFQEEWEDSSKGIELKTKAIAWQLHKFLGKNEKIDLLVQAIVACDPFEVMEELKEF